MKAVIIGGGIIGLCSAYYLHKSGWEITLLDKSDMTDGCSFGNLGMIVPSHFIPLAAPGMVAQGIRWMLNKKSPFFVKPSLNPTLISWGMKFIKSASAKNVETAAPILLNMNLYSKSLYNELQNQPQFAFALEEKGMLMYYKTEKAAEEEMHNASMARDMGVDAIALNRNEVQQLEPHVKPDVLGAIHYRCDAHLYPNKLISQLINYLE